MNDNVRTLIDTLSETHSLSVNDYETVIGGLDEESAAYAKDKAVPLREAVYGHDVYVRGLIEFTNICRNNCYYCGIRRDNGNIRRYRLTEDEIYSCCESGYGMGFRTFVLQGGEDPFFTDEVMCRIIRTIKASYPDCAITLSLGERHESGPDGSLKEETRHSFQVMYEAGADRYLLRHETADEAHYARLHPEEMRLAHRLNCLRALKEIGYQAGCGFMVGSPYQTIQSVAKDLCFIQEFQPAMCGIGPFLPHHDTPFKDERKGSLEMTLYLLSIIRLIKPNVLLPATTALGTIHPKGREMGILAGANVVMPNLSPVGVRKDYMLYDNKICTGDEAAECHDCLETRMEAIGYRIATARGDVKDDTGGIS